MRARDRQPPRSPPAPEALLAVGGDADRHIGGQVEPKRGGQRVDGYLDLAFLGRLACLEKIMFPLNQRASPPFEVSTCAAA